MHVYSPDIPVYRFSRRYINCQQILELTRLQYHLPGVTAAQFYAAVAIHVVPIVVPPGTHYCWVDRGGVDSKLAQGFYTWPALRESNTTPLDLGSNALTTQSRAWFSYISSWRSGVFSRTTLWRIKEFSHTSLKGIHDTSSVFISRNIRVKRSLIR